MTDSPFSGNCLRIERLDGDIAQIVFDRTGDNVNKLDGELIAELGKAVQTLASAHGLCGVLVRSGKSGFLAGADIRQLLTMSTWDEGRISEFCLGMNRVLTSLEELPVPVVCAINGFALGGGFEVALCADYRVLTSDGSVGFPEVGLGILPGAGGTARAPRLTNAATGLEWVAGARTYNPTAALKCGMIDEVCEAQALIDRARLMLQRAMSGELDWQSRRTHRKGAVAPDPEAFAALREKVRSRARHYPAALAVVDLMERSGPMDRDAAIEEEARTFAKLARTPTAKAMIAIFLSTQQLKKQIRKKSTQSHSLKRAAVLGAGIMGGGVTYTTAVRGMPILMKDIAQSQLDLGLSEARKLLDKQVQIGKLSPDHADALHTSIIPQLDFAGFEDVDVVVEAVVENLETKQFVLAETEDAVGAETILASNTSSLSIADIARGLKRPENLVGMHFFNPVHLMPLVEVVRAEKSSDVAVATAVSYALAMGKTPLVVKDCAGFLVNRILGAYFTAFLQLIRDGADFVQIDRVMERFGWPMGPSYLLDVAGLDTLDKALTILGKAYPDVMGTDFRTVIQHLAADKRYGQKTGSGFYRYEADAKGRPRKFGDAEIVAFVKQVQNSDADPINDEQILDRMMLAMVLEAARCLDEEVADSAIAIDAAMRLGTGFPPHLVGPLWYADTLGLSTVIDKSASFGMLGDLYSPGPGLRQRAETSEMFYASFPN